LIVTVFNKQGSTFILDATKDLCDHVVDDVIVDLPGEISHEHHLLMTLKMNLNRGTLGGR
jgi:hypothetical protein